MYVYLYYSSCGEVCIGNVLMLWWHVVELVFPYMHTGSSIYILTVEVKVGLGQLDVAPSQLPVSIAMYYSCQG